MPEGHEVETPAGAATDSITFFGELDELSQERSGQEAAAGTTTPDKNATSVATQLLAAFVAHLISLNCGYAVGWAAVAIPVLKSNGTEYSPPALYMPLSTEECSWVVSASLISSAVGPMLSSQVCRCWGYKPAGYLVGITATMGGVAVLLARGLPALLAGRVVVGMAMGAVPVVANAYMADAAQQHVRGALGTFFALLFNAGILLAYIVGAVATYLEVCAVAVGLPVLYTVCFFFLPESPRYLVSSGKVEEAEKSLRWFRPVGHDIEGELKLMRYELESKSTEGGMSVAEFFRDRASRLGFIAFLILILNQNLDGTGVILNYVVEMFSAADATVSAQWAAVVVAAVQLLATLLSSVLVDRVGRRPLLMASNAGMATCLTAVGWYFFALASGYDVSSLWWLPITSLSLSLVLNACGIGSLLFVIATELFSSDAQAVAFSIGFTAAVVVNATVLKFYVALLDWIDIYGCYWLFAVSCLVSNVYIFFFLPETKNRPITDIVAELNGEKKEKLPYSSLSDSEEGITESVNTLKGGHCAA
ncbi:facilitated trehalose transporter Tret1-like [Schistocerca gregaria]|uniref:facilitated trehalose transporter Tret1-like n=1 Tax=Schistocerca gregaria TaxID=7010 RepID=UPI00211EAA55|nr:facilitated trehalose transporter Tret1-like [Schistocerca gregaria]XP_049834736.1 facilitated trehalose transporter Tret1-like [Schistocerca gregaria]